MRDNETSTNDMQAQPPGYTYDAGAAIFDASGNKIASLSDVGVEHGYLVARHGLLPPRDAYVPLAHITRLDASGIYLDLSGDDLKAMDRDRAPESAPPGESGTSGGKTMWHIGAPGEQPSGATQTPMSQRPPLYIQLLQNTGGTSPARGNLTDQSRTARTDAPDTGATTANQSDLRVPVREEELVAGKRQEERGRVHVRKDVTEQDETISAPVTHEEVNVERVPTAGRPVQPGDDAFQERDIEVPVRGEELVTGKQTRVKDEVHISKRPVTEEQQVSGKVRKEHVNVERTDDQGRALDDDQRQLDDLNDQQSAEQTP